MAALSAKGDVLWRSDLPHNVTHCDSLAIAPCTTWAAVGCRGGLVCVNDVRGGEIIGSASNQGTTPEVMWASHNGKPLLLTASRGALTAWHVKPKETDEAK